MSRTPFNPVLQAVALLVGALIICCQTSSECAAQAQEFTVVVKSYIARMGPPANQRVTPPSAQTQTALGFAQDNSNRSSALFFMYQSDDTFSENPGSPNPAQMDYRLWSSFNFGGMCNASQQIFPWHAGTLETKFGKEGPLNAVGAVMNGVSLTADGKPVTLAQGTLPPHAKTIAISYAVKGRPNDATIPAFDAIRPRGCTWIWHRVNVTASCAGGHINVNVTLTGSAFPSAKAWLNGAVVKTISQGPFEDLWMCNDADHSLVR
jgi:hypothetical protein